jgi:hypothetical protein
MFCRFPSYHWLFTLSLLTGLLTAKGSPDRHLHQSPVKGYCSAGRGGSGLPREPHFGEGSARHIVPRQNSVRGATDTTFESDGCFLDLLHAGKNVSW